MNNLVGAGNFRIYHGVISNQNPLQMNNLSGVD